MQRRFFFFIGIGFLVVVSIPFLIHNAWPVTVNQGPTFTNSQTAYTSATTFIPSSIQVQPSHIYLGSKYYDLNTISGKVAANVTGFNENQNITIHVTNSSLTNVNMTVLGQATRVKIDGTFYGYNTRWSYIQGGTATQINVQSGKDVFVDFTPTVITSTDTRLESSGEQRTSYFDGTNNWIFYYDGSNIVYRFSPNGGTTWSGPASTGSGTLASNSYFGVYGESNKVVITWASTSAIFTKTGNITGTSISFPPTPVSVPLGSNSGQNYYPSFEKVGTNLFLGGNLMVNGANGGGVVKSTNLGSSWSASTLLYFNEAQPAIVGLAKYGNTNLVAIFAKYGNSEFNYTTFNGVSWSPIVRTNGAGLTPNALKTQAFSITSNGTCAWVGYVPSNSGGNLKSMTFCGSFTVPTTVTGGTALYPSISAIGNDIHLFYLNATNNIINRIVNTGGTWLQKLNPFGTTFTNPSFLHAEKSGYGGNHVPVVWREGSTSPFTIRFGISIMTVQWENPGFDYQVTTDTFNQNEPALAAKGDASSLVSGNNDLHDLVGGGNCDIFQSTNGGTGWNSKGTLTKVSTNDQLSDPSISVDSSSNFYYTCAEINPSNHTGLYVVMQRSTDGGNTWPNSYVVATHRTDSIDKPWITADHNSGSAYKNSVYGCWSEFYSNGTSKIFFKRYVVPGSSTIPYDLDSNKVQLDSGAVNGCSIAIGPSGQVYVTWANGGVGFSGTIFLKRNLSGGNPAQWLGPYTVGNYNPTTLTCTDSNGNIQECLPGLNGRSSPFRVNHYPSIATDSGGDVHVTWMTNSSKTTQTDVMYTNSNSCGTTSGSCTFNTPPLKVNLDNTTADQWEPAITVSNSGNIIHITAYDRRDDPNNVFYRPYDYYCSYGSFINCRNQSQWANIQSSSAGSSNIDLSTIIDDYHSVSTSNIRQAYNVWTDSRGISGTSNNNYDIWSERTTR